MKNKRKNRISEEVKKAVSEIILYGLKDPRVSNMTTVTEVEVTRDLSFAKIYISVLGNTEEKNETIQGLNNAKGFIRREIGNKVDLRYVPEPIFYLDESIENAIYMSKLIEDVKKTDEKSKEKNNE